MSMKGLYRKYSGFTLIEVLVVAAIIGILSAVAYISLNEARDKAKIVAAYNDITQFELALRSFRTVNGEPWPVLANNNYVTMQQHSIDALINCSSSCTFPNFSTYLAVAPEPLDGVINYSYANTGTAYECGGDDKHATGVSIRIGNLNASDPDSPFMDELYDYLNQKVDGGDDDRNCGQIRRGGGSSSIYYLIGDN